MGQAQYIVPYSAGRLNDAIGALQMYTHLTDPIVTSVLFCWLIYLSVVGIGHVSVTGA